MWSRKAEGRDHMLIYHYSPCLILEPSSNMQHTLKQHPMQCRVCSERKWGDVLNKDMKVITRIPFYWHCHCQREAAVSGHGATAFITGRREIILDRITLIQYGTKYHIQQSNTIQKRVRTSYTCDTIIFFIWFVRLLALRPFLAYCASLGW
jgi:hypothetical protein